MLLNMHHKSASVTLRVWPDGAATVTNLHAIERRQGHATELMQKVVDRADISGWKLLLTVREFGNPQGMNNAQLRAFYEGFDFVADPVAAPLVFMTRFPPSR